MRRCPRCGRYHEVIGARCDGCGADWGTAFATTYLHTAQIGAAFMVFRVKDADGKDVERVEQKELGHPNVFRSKRAANKAARELGATTGEQLIND